MLPRREIVGERLKLVCPFALFEGREQYLPAVETRSGVLQAVQTLFATGGGESHLNANEVMTFAKCGRTEGDDFADISLRTIEARSRWHDIAEGDASAQGVALFLPRRSGP